jgi:hypothetical protein
VVIWVMRLCSLVYFYLEDGGSVFRRNITTFIDAYNTRRCHNSEDRNVSPKNLFLPSS